MCIKKEKLYEILQDEELTDRIFQNVKTPARMRTLIFNLRRSTFLKEGLLNGSISPEYFAKDMTHKEMMPDNYKEEKPMTISLDDRDGIVKCVKCESMKTEYTELHSLEHTSFLVYCKNCGYTSKI